jgi:hypothetical protein
MPARRILTVLGSSPRGRTTCSKNFGTPVAEAQIVPHRQFRIQSFDLYVDALARALLGRLDGGHLERETLAAMESIASARPRTS